MVNIEMKKLITILALMSVMGVFMVGCGSKDDAAAPPADTGTVTGGAPTTTGATEPATTENQEG